MDGSVRTRFSGDSARTRMKSCPGDPAQSDPQTGAMHRGKTKARGNPEGISACFVHQPQYIIRRLSAGWYGSSSAPTALARPAPMEAIAIVRRRRRRLEEDLPDFLPAPPEGC